LCKQVDGLIPKNSAPPIQTVNFSTKPSAQVGKNVTPTFTASTTSQISILLFSSEVMGDDDNFSNIVEASEQRSQALAGHARAVPASSACCANVQHWREASTLKSRPLSSCVYSRRQLGLKVFDATRNRSAGSFLTHLIHEHETAVAIVLAQIRSDILFHPEFARFAASSQSLGVVQHVGTFVPIQEDVEVHRHGGTASLRSPHSGP
jgi:hypothetical protein